MKFIVIATVGIAVVVESCNLLNTPKYVSSFSSLNTCLELDNDWKFDLNSLLSTGLDLDACLENESQKQCDDVIKNYASYAGSDNYLNQIGTSLLEYPLKTCECLEKSVPQFEQCSHAMDNYQRYCDSFVLSEKSPTSCSDELREICPNFKEMSFNQTMHCLKGHVFELERACFSLLSSFVGSLVNYCGSDILSLCSEYIMKGPVGLMTCLAENMSQLKPTCQIKLETIATNFVPCISEAETFCKDVKSPEAVLDCLASQDGATQQTFGETCQDVISSYENCRNEDVPDDRKKGGGDKNADNDDNIDDNGDDGNDDDDNGENNEAPPPRKRKPKPRPGRGAGGGDGNGDQNGEGESEAASAWHRNTETVSTAELGPRTQNYGLAAVRKPASHQILRSLLSDKYPGGNGPPDAPPAGSGPPNGGPPNGPPPRGSNPPGGRIPPPCWAIGTDLEDKITHQGGGGGTGGAAGGSGGEQSGAPKKRNRQPRGPPDEDATLDESLENRPGKGGMLVPLVAILVIGVLLFAVWRKNGSTTAELTPGRACELLKAIFSDILFAITGLLSRLGVPVPRQLMPAGASVESGGYETAAVESDDEDGSSSIPSGKKPAIMVPCAVEMKGFGDQQNRPESSQTV